MRYNLLLLFTVLAMSLSTGWLKAQTNPCVSLDSFKIVILGSSTAAGTGPSSPDSAWVNRYRDYLQSINPANDVINLAVGGYNTYRIMPTSFIPPPSRPLPDPARNITAALALNPDAIIVNMPSNDVAAGYSYAEQIFNFDSIITVSGTGSVPIWICTTQPRNFSLAQQQLQWDLKDSIIALYSPNVIDFWSSIAMVDFSIDPFYDSGDGVHLNDTGHALLNDRVINLNLLDQLYVPIVYSDVAILSVDPSGDLTCGDSTATFDIVATNVGTNDSIPVKVEFKMIHSPSGAVFNDSIIIPAGLAGCSPDTFSFVANTFNEGTYSITAIVSSTSDPNTLNDTTIIVMHLSGHPTIIPIHDTLCNPGIGQLSVTHSSQDTVIWYDDLINPVPIVFGSALITPMISSSTAWYAEVVRGDLFYSDDIFTTNTSSINWNGAMFDIVAQSDLTIDSFDVKINSQGLQEVEIYTKVGTHIGSELFSSAWSFQGSVFVNVLSSSEQTHIPLGNISLLSNDTIGVYMQMADPTSSLSYQNTGSAMSYSNTEITVITGSGSSHDFGGNYYPRNWNGRIHYHHGTRLQGDCSTGRHEVRVEISPLNFTIGSDTIIDILDTLTITAPVGMNSYEWFDGSQAQSYQLIASDLGVGIHHVFVQITDSLLCTSTDTIIVAIADLVGIEEQSAAIIVYPNPTSGLLHFKNPTFNSIELRSVTGLEIRTYPVISNMIDLSEIPDGCYFLTIPNLLDSPIKIIKHQ